jgi:hypothetical protein
METHFQVVLRVFHYCNVRHLHCLGHDEYVRRFGQFVPIINYFADIFLLVLYLDISDSGLELILEPSDY